MPHCSQNIYVFQPKHDDTPSSCVNNIVSKDVVFKAEFCGIKLSTLDWNETKYLKVYGFSDGIYNQQDRSTYIQLSTTTVRWRIIMFRLKYVDILTTVWHKTTV
jgi:hypothetical protein